MYPMGEPRSHGSADILLARGFAPHRVALEDYVAYQWEAVGDLLGTRSIQRRDQLALRWLYDAVRQVGAPTSALDIGCAYGNHLFMLNAMLGKPQSVELVGVDLFDKAIQVANTFAEQIPGYSNCRFHLVDITQGLPFPDSSFEAINACDVIEHLIDPRQSLLEMRRVARPGATIVLSTPLRDSVFKTLARKANRLTKGRLYRSYYAGKDTSLGPTGMPIMETPAGHDHVSEMNLTELQGLCRDLGLRIEQMEPMSILSGSKWFGRHDFVLAGALALEAVHDRLRRPNWSHSVMLRLRSVR